MGRFRGFELGRRGGLRNHLSGNTTSYSVTDEREVTEFLRKFKGQRVFTVSW